MFPSTLIISPKSISCFPQHIAGIRRLSRSQPNHHPHSISFFGEFQAELGASSRVHGVPPPFPSTFVQFVAEKRRRRRCRPTASAAPEPPRLTRRLPRAASLPMCALFSLPSRLVGLLVDSSNKQSGFVKNSNPHGHASMMPDSSSTIPVHNLLLPVPPSVSSQLQVRVPPNTRLTTIKSTRYASNQCSNSFFHAFGIIHSSTS